MGRRKFSIGSYIHLQSNSSPQSNIPDIEISIFVIFRWKPSFHRQYGTTRTRPVEGVVIGKSRVLYYLCRHKHAERIPFSRGRTLYNFAAKTFLVSRSSCGGGRLNRRLAPGQFVPSPTLVCMAFSSLGDPCGFPHLACVMYVILLRNVWIWPNCYRI